MILQKNSWRVNGKIMTFRLVRVFPKPVLAFVRNISSKSSDCFVIWNAGLNGLEINIEWMNLSTW